MPPNIKMGQLFVVEKHNPFFQKSWKNRLVSHKYFKIEIKAKWPILQGFRIFNQIIYPNVDLDSKVFLGQSVAQSFAWTCSALSIMHVSNFKVLAQIL